MILEKNQVNKVLFAYLSYLLNLSQYAILATDVFIPHIRQSININTFVSVDNPKYCYVAKESCSFLSFAM